MNKKFNSTTLEKQKKSIFSGKKWKNFLRAFCLVAVFGVFALTCLAGCDKATVGNIQNAYSGLIFNGGAAVCVNNGTNNFLYFGNAYVSDTSFGNDGAYQSAAANAFLARVNLDNLSKANADSSVAPTDKNHSPRVVENVTNEVVSYNKGFSFVLGQNIYYCIPNRKKVNADGSTENNYTYTTIMSSTLDGKNKHIVFERTEEMKQMEVLQAEGQHFLVFLVGSDLVSINLTRGGTTTLATNVDDVALPKTQQKDCAGSTADFNGKIYYITNNKNETKKVVKEVTLATGEKNENDLYFCESGSIEFVARINDTIFFTESDTSNGQMYMANLATGQMGFGGKIEVVVPSASDSADVFALFSSSANQNTNPNGQADNTEFGYVIVSGSSAYYVPSIGTMGASQASVTATKITLSGTMSQAICTSGRTFYYATSNGIYSADLATPSNPTCTPIATGLSITSGASFAFDGKFVYFYATLASIDEESTAEGNFLYCAQIGKGGQDSDNNWQLVSYVSSRISKDEQN